MQKEDYIDKNKGLLQEFAVQATGERRLFLGYSDHSPQEAFDAVLEHGNIYYLPLCLFFIFFGFGVARNRSFALNGLTELSFSEPETIECEFSAYLLAYCLRKNNNILQSKKVLTLLIDTEFSPSLCTQGDFHVFCGDKSLAEEQYRRAASKGHLYAQRRLVHLMNENKAFGWMIKPFHYAKITKKILKLNNKGEKCLYLDFYGLSKS